MHHSFERSLDVAMMALVLTAVYTLAPGMGELGTS